MIAALVYAFVLFGLSALTSAGVFSILLDGLTGLDINDGISAAVTTALGGVLAIHAVVALVEFS